MIRTENLVKKYTTDEVETTALNELNIEILEGDFVAVMGASGCGKSTLLNVLGMLDKPDSGKHYFNGIEVGALSEKKRSEIRRDTIGFVFQSFNLIDELSVFENVELPLVYQKIPKSTRKEKVDQVLEKMGIGHRAKHYPQQLSGGQQQRVAVARAVINQPKLILADEPTGNLDSHHGNEVMDLLTNLNSLGTTILMVTHSQHDAAFAKRLIRLLDGEVVSENEQQPAGNF